MSSLSTRRRVRLSALPVAVGGLLLAPLTPAQPAQAVPRHVMEVKKAAMSFYVNDRLQCRAEQAGMTGQSSTSITHDGSNKTLTLQGGCRGRFGYLSGTLTVQGELQQDRLVVKPLLTVRGGQPVSAEPGTIGPGWGNESWLARATNGSVTMVTGFVVCNCPPLT